MPLQHLLKYVARIYLINPSSFLLNCEGIKAELQWTQNLILIGGWKILKQENL